MRVLTPMHPGRRIMDGHLVPVLEADLAHDVSLERRDSKGRWTDGSSAPLPGQPKYADVADYYEFSKFDKAGSDGTPMTKTSIRQQEDAQIRAKTWASNIDGESSEDDQYAASLWQQYQSATLYGLINATLRTGKTQKGGPTAEKMRHYADVAFQEGGTTTKEPTVFYHAIKSQKDDWAAKLQPGMVFHDGGFLSTTAHPRFAQGWLNLNPDDSGSHGEGRPVTTKDVVIEMRTPAGTRIMGGDPQFIETMFHPGTRLKIVSSETRHADKATNPLGGHPDKPFDYTHIIAEVIPA